MSNAASVIRWITASVGLGLIVGGGWAASSVLRVGVAGANAGQVTLGIALLFVGLPMFALPLLLQTRVLPDRGAPWAAALGRIAAEHGQVVQSDRDVGVWFDIVHGGPRFTVLVEPAQNRLLLKCRQGARHGVNVVRRGLTDGEDVFRWAEVCRGESWSMRAEVRVAAVSMGQNAPLVRALDRFFAFRGAVAVRFGATGLELELRLPTPESTPDVIRAGMDVARAIFLAAER